MKYDTKNCKILQCTKCDISINSNITNGYGDIHGGMVIIGEAPGYYEDKHQIPFVGDSGELLNNLLFMIGIRRTRIYTTNVIKCRPDGNRAPSAKEVRNCLNYLKYELYIAKPKIVVLLGSIAIKTYFGSKVNIKHVRQRPILYNNTIIYILYHTIFILRNEDKTGLVKSYENTFKNIGNAYKYFIDGTISFNY